jgi:hypothetical protein
VCKPERLYRDENGWKRTENPSPVSVSAFYHRKRDGSGIVENVNGSGINGIAKTNGNGNTNGNS